jgi:hypothetical protein
MFERAGAARPRYEVFRGINYGPDGRRAEVGAVIDDITPDDAGWLLDAGYLAPTSKPVTGQVAEPAADDEPEADGPGQED